MAKYKYLFESSKPERVKRREAAERKQKRSEESRKAWEKRKQKAQAAPAAPTDNQIKSKIRYLNQRLRKFGDPDHMVALLPDAIKTDTGYLSTRPESIKFFSGNPELLAQIQSVIRKHPVSNQIRDTFEEMLHDIYDQITEIGQDRFFEIVGKDFQKQLGTDADTNLKMQDMLSQWEKARAAIPAYYEEQIRQGKLTPFTD